MGMELIMHAAIIMLSLLLCSCVNIERSKNSLKATAQAHLKKLDLASAVSTQLGSPTVKSPSNAL